LPGHLSSNEAAQVFGSGEGFGPWPPAILAQPQSVVAPVGSNVTFNGGASRRDDYGTFFPYTSFSGYPN
jgi:hypothetical protein